MQGSLPTPFLLLCDVVPSYYIWNADFASHFRLLFGVQKSGWDSKNNLRRKLSVKLARFASDPLPSVMWCSTILLYMERRLCIRGQRMRFSRYGGLGDGVQKSDWNSEIRLEVWNHIFNYLRVHREILESVPRRSWIWVGSKSDLRRI